MLKNNSFGASVISIREYNGNCTIKRFKVILHFRKMILSNYHKYDTGFSLNIFNFVTNEQNINTNFKETLFK